MSSLFIYWTFIQIYRKMHNLSVVLFSFQQFHEPVTWLLGYNCLKIMLVNDVLLPSNSQLLSYQKLVKYSKTQIFACKVIFLSFLISTWCQLFTKSDKKWCRYRLLIIRLKSFMAWLLKKIVFLCIVDTGRKWSDEERGRWYWPTGRTRTLETTDGQV